MCKHSVLRNLDAMKNTFLISCFCTFLSLTSYSQTVYLADTAFTTDVGYGGAGASCIAPHMQSDGWQMARSQGTWLADVFTVPAGSTWVFDTVIVYGYQHYSGTTSTMLDCNLQIYDGAPGLGGNVIWGDTVTNVLAATGFTGIYRVDTISSHGGLNSTERPIMYLTLHLSPAPRLSAGTYWLSWAAAGSLAITPSSPDKVLPGRINPSGQQGRQLYAGSWYYVEDSSKTVGFNKIIKASPGLSVEHLQERAAPLLSQNFPNPFSGTTQISYYLPRGGKARLTVYDVLGQQVAILADGDMKPGNHMATFNARKLAEGTYVCKLTTESGIASRQMLLVK